MSESGQESIESQVFSYENAWQFLGWMFKNLSPEQFAEVPENYLPELFNVIEQNAIDRYDKLPPARRKKQLLAPLDFVRRWKHGQSYDEIYQQTGLTEDRFRFSLITYAERLGEIETLEGLLSSTKASLDEASAATAERPPMPNCEEVARIAIQKTIKPPSPEAAKPQVGFDEEPPEEKDEYIEPPEDTGPLDEVKLEALLQQFPLLAARMSDADRATLAKNLKLS